MIYGEYQFSCNLDNDAILPPYKGSTFRGVFGRALKKVVCALKRQECDQCLLNQKCIYASVFETSKTANPPKDSRFASVPHPFVIQPPLTVETEFSKGTPFDFHLLVFGEVNNSLPYFIYAFDQMGKIGIGKKINGKRGQFTLEEVRLSGDIVYSHIDQKLKAIDSLKTLTLSDLENHSEGSSSLKVVIETPLRLKYKNRFNAELPFHILVRAMLRRISSLLNCYGEGEPSIDYRGLVKRAEAVQIIDSNLNWFDWQRYSLRQDKSMLMGGIVGSVTYQGEISEYLPLFDYCTKVHLGKQTTFGLGKIRTEILK